MPGSFQTIQLSRMGVRSLCFNASQKSHKYRCVLDFDAQAFGHAERQKDGQLEVSIRSYLCGRNANC